MGTSYKLFGSLLLFVCHGFDRVVILAYLPLLAREIKDVDLVVSQLLGDCDVDGDALDIFDVLTTFNIVRGRSTPSPTQVTACDVTCDNEIDIFDLLGQINGLLGRVSPPLPCRDR